MAINVQLGANAGPAINAINQLSNSLGGLNGPANSASNALNNLNNSAGQTRNRLNNLPPASNGASNGLNNLGNSAGRTRNQLNNFNNTANQSVNTLTNVGRVVQDAPFGFLGIANNLNPLLESFQRLRQSTGSVGGAFRGLGQQLAGPAGIGIALSIVSSLLIVFGDSLFGSAQKVKALQQATEDMSDALKNLKTRLDDVKDSVDFGASLQRLDLQISGLKDGSLDLAEATGKLAANTTAIAEQKSLLAPFEKDFFAADKKATQLVAKYEALEKTVKSLKSTLAQGTFDPTLANTIARRESQVNDIKDLAIAYKQFFKNKNVGDAFTSELSKKQKAEFDNYVNLFNNTKDAREKINGLERDSEVQTRNITLAKIKIREEEAKKAKESAKKIEEANKKIIEKAKELKQFFEGEVVAPAFNIFSSPEEQLADAKKFIDDINNRLANVTAIRVPLIPLPPRVEFFEKVIKTAFGPGGIPIKFQDAKSTGNLPSLAESVKNSLAGFPDAVKATEKLRQGFIQTGQAIASFITPAINQMIDAIRQGESVFRAFGQAIVNIFTSVIQKLIQTAIIAGIISLISGGVGNVAKGGMNFAQAFKSQFGGFRAAGGPVTAGRGYVVGENGPEWFQPQTNGSIVSNSQLNGGIASTSGIGAMNVVVRGNLRGDTIRLQQARTTRRQGRIV